jgi:hypothetical protein
MRKRVDPKEKQKNRNECARKYRVKQRVLEEMKDDRLKMAEERNSSLKNKLSRQNEVKNSFLLYINQSIMNNSSLSTPSVWPSEANGSTRSYQMHDMQETSFIETSEHLASTRPMSCCQSETCFQDPYQSNRDEQTVFSYEQLVKAQTKIGTDRAPLNDSFFYVNNRINESNQSSNSLTSKNYYEHSSRITSAIVLEDSLKQQEQEQNFPLKDSQTQHDSNSGHVSEIDSFAKLSINALNETYQNEPYLDENDFVNRETYLPYCIEVGSESKISLSEIRIEATRDLEEMSEFIDRADPNLLLSLI